MPIDNVGTVGEVVLGGHILQVVPKTYQRFAVTPFAPRIATSNPSHSTLDAWQSQSITDWSHGFGFADALDDAGYDFTSGNMDTRNPHELRLGPVKNVVSFPSVQVNCMADFWPSGANGLLYCGLNTVNASTTVWSVNNGATAAAVNGAGCPTTAVTDMIAATDVSGNDLLFVALSDTSDVAFKTWNGTAWTAGTNGASTAYAKYWAIAGGYLWYADRTNKVYYSDDPTDAWSAAIPVGWNSHNITALCEFNGLLYVGKENGLYVVDPATEQAKSVLTFRDQVSPGRLDCRPLVEWNGYLYFRFWNVLYRISPGGALSEVTPNRFDVTFPFVQYKNFRAFAPARKYLYYAAQRTDNNGYDLLAFDGVAHHRLCMTASADSSGVPLAGGYVSDIAANPRLWMATIPTGTTLGYLNLRNDDLPFDDYDTGALNYLETSRFDMGMPEIVKSWKDITLEMSNVNAGRSASVTFATDDSQAFNYLGTTGQVGNQTAWAGAAASVNAAGALWSGTGNALVQDGAYAESTVAVNSTNTTDLLRLTSYGFSVPTAATILGVTVQPYTFTTATATMTTLQLVVNGAAIGNNKGSATTGWNPLRAPAYGSATDVWGASLTPAIVNRTDFGLQVQGTSTNGVTLGVDAAYMVVSYASFTRYITLGFPRKDGTVTSSSDTSLTDTVNLTEADDAWDGAMIDIVSGTGAGQTRQISSYNGGNNTCTIYEVWETNPDTTSRYQITWQSRKIRFRVYLATNSGTQTIVLRSFTMRFQPRPPLKRGWRFSVRAADLMELNNGAIRSDLSADNIMDLCFFWRDVKAPIQFEDKDHNTYYVEVSEAAATEVKYNPSDQLTEGQTEYVVNLSLVEA